MELQFEIFSQVIVFQLSKNSSVFGSNLVASSEHKQLFWKKNV